MKKPWKPALAAVGIPVLCVGLLAFDSYDRAVAAIAGQDFRLTKDIAALRSGLPPKYPLDESSVSAELLKKVPCPASMIGGADPEVLNLGHSGNVSRYGDLFSDYMGYNQQRSFWTPSPDPVLSGDEVIAALALTHNTLQEGGYAMRCYALGFEENALQSLRNTLVGTSVTAAGLQRLGKALDDLQGRRLSIPQILLAEHLIDRAEVLRVLHLKADPRCFIRRGPGWREFFSWRILIAKCLNQLEDRYRRLRELDSVSWPEWKPAVEQIRHAADLTASELIGTAADTRHSELATLCLWRLARTAVAVKLYEIERRREPARIEDLVPDFLPQLPLNPFTGEPFEVRNGEIGTRASIKDSPTISWVTRGK